MGRMLEREVAPSFLGIGHMIPSFQLVGMCWFRQRISRSVYAVDWVGSDQALIMLAVTMDGPGALFLCKDLIAERKSDSDIGCCIDLLMSSVICDGREHLQVDWSCCIISGGMAEGRGR